MADPEVSRLTRRSSTISAGAGLLFCSFLLAGCVRYHAKPLAPVQYQTDFLSRDLQNPGLVAFVRENGALSAACPPKSLTLADANLIAAYYSPDLPVARAQLESAKAAVITAGGRPNPELAGNAGYETVSGHPIAIYFELSLPLETAGKRHYRILAAQEQLGAASVDLQEAEWNTYRKATNAWFEDASAQESAAAYRAEAAERAKAVTLLEQRLAVGEISEPVVSQASVAASEAALASAAAEARKERLKQIWPLRCACHWKPYRRSCLIQGISLLRWRLNRCLSSPCSRRAVSIDWMCAGLSLNCGGGSSTAFGYRAAVSRHPVEPNL